MDFLVHSYLQTGQDRAAKRVIDEATTIKIIPHILDAYAMAAMPTRYAVERQRWGRGGALTLPQQREFAWNLFPHAEAALVFGRALGAARNGDIDAARKDLDRLQELRINLMKANSEGTWQEYWVSEIENNRQMVTAWITYNKAVPTKLCKCCVPLPIARTLRRGIPLCRAVSSPRDSFLEKCCWRRIIR